ncbi:MAG TPA: cyclic nucleotide-binding domain-containing protein [bacterium]|nr:cyclic nucleotide-binding domain-containing protein [bacterium]
MVQAAELRQVKQFAAFTDEELTALADLVRERSFLAEELIISEGELGNDLFVLLKGQVAVTRIMARGEQMQVGMVNEGEIFGEMSFLDRKPRTASVKTLKPCRTLVISRDKFEQLYQSNLLMYARFLRLIADTITERLRKLGNQLNKRVLWA